MIVRIDLKKLEANAVNRPDDYVARVTSYGKVSDGHLWIDSHIYASLWRRYHYGPPPAEMARSFVKSMIKWVKDGNWVDEDLFRVRKAVCDACPHWRGDAYMGFGKCVQCGCGGIKLHLSTEKCPIGRWN